MLQLLIPLLILAVAAAAISRMRAPAPAAPPTALTVAATIFPLADWLREVGGSDVHVHLLVRDGLDPHHFEPAVSDAVLLAHADAVFAVGLELDPWTRRLAKNAHGDGKPKFFETGTWIGARPFGTAKHIEIHAQGGAAPDDDDHHEHGGKDPHFWLDPARARTVVQRMAQELSILDPAHREAFQRRATEYTAKLEALDEKLRLAAKSIPPGKLVVTFHDAYGYLFARLGVKVAAVVQASPGIEPTPRDCSDAIRAMRDVGQRTVFKEPQSPERAVRLIADELHGGITLLDPMDTSLSETGKTYLERMSYDIETLARVLSEGAK